jgi:hypothetical protein
MSPTSAGTDSGTKRTTLDAENVYSSISRLERWIDGRYEGWDPYDGLNSSKVQNIKLGSPYLQMGLVQLHRLSPLNLRALFGVEKGVDTKGLAVFVQAYLTLHSATGEERYLRQATELSETIIGNSLKKSVGDHVWASHYFPFIAADKGALTPTVPDIIGTSNVLKALSLLQLTTREERLDEVIGSCQSFLRRMVERRDGHAYFMYTPEWKGKIVPNASAEALGAIASSLRARPNDELRALCDEVLQTVLRLQREDGSWVYSIYPNGREYLQHDFHQGYMISGLLSYRDLALAELREDIDSAIGRALTFYRSLFLEDGRSLYRAPQRFPVDIHNQSQGIITLTQAGEWSGNPPDIDMARTIAGWTIKNMQDGKGFFYYQKWPLVMNKIPFMRWSQAWMLLALASLYAHERNGRIL